MIIDLPSTTTAAVNRKLVDLRDTGGAVALGRVLTLVIVTDEQGAEVAIEAANDASREHPCRVIVIVQGNRRGADRIDAQVRVGGDAGASEVIVLRLYGQLTAHADSVVTPMARNARMSSRSNARLAGVCAPIGTNATSATRSTSTADGRSRFIGDLPGCG